MRLGLIARADDSGLGVQSLEFFRHMQPDKVLVIDVGHLHNDTTHTNKRTDLSRYPGAVRCEGWLPHAEQMLSFIRDLDVVFSCETFYRHDLPDMARGMGVRTVLQPNYEFLDPHLTPDVWAAPSSWNYDLIPDPKIHLPVPIATDRFPADFPTARHATRFLHIVGRPAIHDRNGTADLLQALQFVKSDITVTVKCQTPGYVHQLGTHVPNNITLVVNDSPVDNYWEMYQGHDVLIMPRRFGGLCLPVNEALGSGMPVIMPNVSPNNTWLPAEWLVPASHSGSFRAKQPVDYCHSDINALADLIDRFATDEAFYRQAMNETSRLRNEYSWDTLKPLYSQVLCEVT